jgi:predicted nucleic acid-binding protein
LSRDWVIDANVGVKFYLPEDLAEAAQHLLLRLNEGDTSLFVPDLFYKESANIFWKYVRRAGLPPDDARRSLRNLISLPLTVVPGTDLVLYALDLAVDHDITAYDASYVALAHDLRLPLVTADRKLLRKLAGTGTDIRWLGDLDL